MWKEFEKPIKMILEEIIDQKYGNLSKAQLKEDLWNK